MEEGTLGAEDVVPLGGGWRWVAHHTWHPNRSTQVDGQAVGAAGETVQVDVCGLGDEDAQGLDVAGVRRRWQGHEVTGVVNSDAPIELVVPTETLHLDAVQLALLWWRNGQVVTVAAPTDH